MCIIPDLRIRVAFVWSVLQKFDCTAVKAHLHPSERGHVMHSRAGHMTCIHLRDVQKNLPALNTH